MEVFQFSLLFSIYLIGVKYEQCVIQGLKEHLQDFQNIWCFRQNVEE